MSYAFKPVGIKSGTFLIISTDGTKSLVEKRPTIKDIEKRIGADYLDTVNLRHDEIMLVDDLGISKGKPLNPEAFALMRERFPGYPNPICGDVAIVLDSDFA